MFVDAKDRHLFHVQIKISRLKDSDSLAESDLFDPDFCSLKDRPTEFVRTTNHALLSFASGTEEFPGAAHRGHVHAMSRRRRGSAARALCASPDPRTVDRTCDTLEVVGQWPDT